MSSAVRETFEVTENYDEERLDKFLVILYPQYSRNFFQKLIRNRCVQINGTVEVRTSARVHYMDEVSVLFAEAVETAILPENIPLDILYEDDDVLIVNKPKGMVVHPCAGHYTGTLVNAIMYHCREQLSGINGEIRPGIVHRIDMNTTGSLIVCKNDQAHRKIAEQIKVHSVNRVYRGIVSGVVKQDEGTIEGNIGRHPTQRKKMAVVTQGGKPAVTHYQVLERFSDATYMEFRLETGRTHQIRVHMANIGHPLLGDTVYGSQKNPYHLTGQTLHAYSIGFLHPTTGDYVEFTAPLPEYFTELLRKFTVQSDNSRV